ncbi:GNAT family N-acetyltransferase [Amycolatopsis sp. FDAARGOS 1241]|uniref:GNAT family N-acetyltransferase n=1 Tax=Amycolatopsis sp. FDAARGOS 1241 TaxID=2778070 RepID=UPI001950F941|nr:GNAT family N-acetyltransferase [Amycolatopsis sp. FDAARGOS 1241]QRP44182.1 GNAT family N-acetyltransferase [Amycolatopsis sp. FDAARGOS 1241]
MSLDLAVANAAAFWTALAESRGHALTTRPGFVCVHGSERSGMRIVLRSATPSADDVAELTELAKNGTTVVVEDAYGCVDLEPLGLSARQLPVMTRTGPGFGAGDVVLADTPDLLAAVEDVVVHGFPLGRHQPYVRGEVFPPGLLERDDLSARLLLRDGEPAGACLVVRGGGAVGLYWVTTAPAFRSRGIGRALMHAVLSEVDGEVVTLTASKLGKPLYDALEFTTVAMASWWA